jgi:hypothetical protein
MEFQGIVSLDSINILETQRQAEKFIANSDLTKQ